MNDRQQLHALVDSLPKGALDAVEKYLEYMQTWPRTEAEGKANRAQSNVAQFTRELEEKRDKFLQGGSSGTWVIDRKNEIHGSFGSSESNRETGELTMRTFRVHHDFPMEITERFRMKDSDAKLEYEFHISGLGKEHSFVLEFAADGG